MTEKLEMDRTQWTQQSAPDMQLRYVTALISTQTNCLTISHVYHVVSISFISRHVSAQMSLVFCPHFGTRSQ